MCRRNAYIRCFHLPNLNRFEPMIRLEVLSVLVVSLRRRDCMVFQNVREFGQILVFQTSPDLIKVWGTIERENLPCKWFDILHRLDYSRLEENRHSGLFVFRCHGNHRWQQDRECRQRLQGSLFSARNQKHQQKSKYSGKWKGMGKNSARKILTFSQFLERLAIS